MKATHTPEMETFFEAVLCLKTEEECRSFFEDVCTIKELQAMAQRLQVAIQLDDGLNYNTVWENTGVSSATICRVNKCLQYGDGGYRTVLDRLNQRRGNSDDQTG